MYCPHLETSDKVTCGTCRQDTRNRLREIEMYLLLLSKESESRNEIGIGLTAYNLFIEVKLLKALV